MSNIQIKVEEGDASQGAGMSEQFSQLRPKP